MEEDAYKTYRDKGLLILNVFVGSKDNDIKEFVETFHLSTPVGGDNGMTKAFHITSIPVTVFIGKDGEIKKQVNGTIKYKPLHEGIQELLQ